MPALSVLRIATATLLGGLTTGCMLFARPPKDLDYGRTRVSEAGLYRGTIRPQGDTIPQGRLHRWTLHLETAQGAPVAPVIEGPERVEKRAGAEEGREALGRVGHGVSGRGRSAPAARPSGCPWLRRAP